jgi:hypothetical protein
MQPSDELLPDLLAVFATPRERFDEQDSALARTTRQQELTRVISQERGWLAWAAIHLDFLAQSSFRVASSCSGCGPR